MDNCGCQTVILPNFNVKDLSDVDLRIILCNLYKVPVIFFGDQPSVLSTNQILRHYVDGACTEQSD